jgi:CRISPR type IV-associated protein Csf3
MKNASSNGPETFKVVIHMKTPAIIQGDLTLESLLAACVHDESGKMRDEALEDVPIASYAADEDRIWMASSVMFGGRVKIDDHIVVRGRHFSETGPDFYEAIPGARKDAWAIPGSQTNGQYIRLMNQYPVVEVSELIWLAKGDMARCKELLSTQGWIGKRRGSGFGEVSQITVSSWEGDVLVDKQGKVRRPVAIRKLHHIPGALGKDQQRVISAVDKHPMWLHEPELCAVPPSRLFIRETPKSEVGEMFFG